MSIISAIISFIPFQAGSAHPQQQSGTQERDYFCVSPENERDWNAALLEFAHDQCQLSQLNIQQIPAEDRAEIRAQFIRTNGGGRTDTPRSRRVNQWEILADYFDSTWLFSPLASLIRDLAGADYCTGSLVYIEPDNLCQSLSAAIAPPESQPASPPPPVATTPQQQPPVVPSPPPPPVIVQQPPVDPPPPPVRQRPIPRPPVNPPPVVQPPPPRPPRNWGQL